MEGRGGRRRRGEEIRREGGGGEGKGERGREGVNVCRKWDREGLGRK